MTTDHRILDANFNRAREALRVLEDYARFVLDDAHLSRLAKTLRHDLSQAAAQLPLRELLASRDTPHDVGTTLSTPTETKRDDLMHVVNAAAKRASEALRCLEEYSKIDYPQVSARFEAVRYRCYDLEKQVLLRAEPRERLAKVRLYVLLTEKLCRLPILDVAKAVLAGGADCIQLREKDKTDREIIELAVNIGRLCHQHGALFMMNDRVDLALAAGADGVHLGQTDLTVTQARKIAGAGLIIGHSTHNPDEIESALRENADYIAVGAIFGSGTKPEVPTAGVGLIRQIRQATSRPVIAIGGITADNAGQAIEAGATGVAVCGAVVGVDNPQKASQDIVNTIVKSAPSSSAASDTPSCRPNDQTTGQNPKKSANRAQPAS